MPNLLEARDIRRQMQASPDPVVAALANLVRPWAAWVKALDPAAQVGIGERALAIWHATESTDLADYHGCVDSAERLAA